MVSPADHNSPLDTLVDMDCTSDNEPGALKLINFVEKQLAQLNIFPSRGYTVGSLPVVFSRNKHHDFPQGHDGPIRRLLDKPQVTRGLIEATTQHFQDELRTLLQVHPTHTVSHARLPHSINSKKHRQSATLLSYIMRTFCPAGIPAIFPNPEEDITEEDIRDIILTLPIDPKKISDEVIKKMDLAPDDYDSFTYQARLRYKLWIRRRFLAILACARVFEREPTLHSPGKSTARLISFRTESGKPKIAMFGTTTDMYDHVTGIETIRHNRKKISGTSFRIMESSSALIRSQEQTLVKLLEKGEHVQGFLSLFEEYSRMETSTREELVADALSYFIGKGGYHGDKVVEFLSKLLKTPSMVGHINRTLKELLGDIRGKVHEINTTYKILLEKWDTIRGPKR